MSNLILSVTIFSVLSFSSHIWAADARCKGIDYDDLKGSLIQYIEGEGRHVFVTRLWYTLTLRQKESTATYLARCKSKGGWVRIYDAHTGRELGKYGSLGYSNYER